MFLQKPMLGAQLDHSDSLNNPVLDLLFNEGHGDIVNDLSGYGNHGTLHGFDFPPTKTSGWNPGQDGVALNFDGSDDYISVPDSPSLRLTKVITVDISMKRGDASDSERCLGKMNNDWSKGWIVDTSGAKIKVYIGTGAAWSTFNVISRELTIGQQYRIVISFNSDSVLNMYVDGVLDDSTPSLNQIIDGGDALMMGNSCDGGGNFLNGTIARLRILPREMSAFEVMQTQINPYGAYLQ